MRVILVTLLCLVAIGCNADPRCRRETALLRAEYLDLEDKYYQLKSEHESSVEVAHYDEGEIIYEGDAGYDELIYEGEVIHEVPMTGYETSSSPQQAAPKSSGSSSVVQTPVVQPERRGVESFNEFQITLPSDAETESARIHVLPEPPNADAGKPQSRLILNSPKIDVASRRASKSAANITEVVINRDVTRGHDVDGIPGDEGIDLLIQPRTSNGRIEYQTGELTVSVIDPAVSPDRQRIGLWKFLPGETELFFANDERGDRGILLHLPWDQSTPTNNKLRVHVRLITPDGRTFKTSTELRIKPPAPGYSADNPLVTGWTLRDRRWIVNSESVPGSNPNDDWRPRERSGVAASVSSPRRNSDTRASSMPTIEAKAEIDKPRWRPIR
jgi:hypothetical protein